MQRTHTYTDDKTNKLIAINLPSCNNNATSAGLSQSCYINTRTAFDHAHTEAAMMEESDLVLVSGASGFVACHVVQQLQQAGYRVRGTVRSLKNEAKVKPIRELCPDAAHPIELVEADLLDADTWPKAVKGCTYVIHTASPFPAANPKHEDELVKPAVEGTLNVLRAAHAAGTVKRVVVTSSMAAVFGAETGANGVTYNEDDFPDASEKHMEPYVKSKSKAEKAAWDFAKTANFELAVVNPGFIVGPVLSGGDATSIVLVRQLMHREMPLIPKLHMPCIDVRDVARAHVRAMTMPEAAGKRHCTVQDGLWFKDLALILQKEFSQQGYKVPTTEAPYFLLWIMARFDSNLRLVLPSIGAKATYDNSRIRNVLKIDPIPMEKSLVDMAYSAVEKGFVKKTTKYKPNTVVPK